MSSFKVREKKKKREYDTLIPKAKKGETLHKLLFTASSYTFLYCPKTLAFQELCFLACVSSLTVEEMTGFCEC